jgi:hypothetical protein
MTENTFTNGLIASFYQYINEKFIDFKAVVLSKTEEYPLGIDISNNEVYMTFIKYFLYALLREKGIRRKIIQSEIRDENQPPIVLLYYKLPNIKYNDPIVQICRHMVLDTANMAIISLGLPRSSTFDKFCEHISEDAYFEECPERTMIIYNPSLNNIYKLVKYYLLNNLEDIEDIDDINDKNGKDDKDDKDDGEIIYTKTLIKLDSGISTRSLIGGHSTFTSDIMSLEEMFEENNFKQNNNLSLIPDDIKNSYCLVFNLSHPKNFIVQKNTNIYRNMLVAAFKFRSYDITNTLWTNYVKQFVRTDSTEEQYKLNLQEAITNMFTNAVICVPLENIVLDFNKFGVNLSIPRRIDISAHLFYPDMNYLPESFYYFVEKYPKLYELFKESPVGIMCKTLTGYRTILNNHDYLKLYELRGNIPVYPHLNNQKNTYNLFKVFWQLKYSKQKYLEYIEYFDNTDKFYSNIFSYFHSTLLTLITKTQKVYYRAYIKKTLDWKEIPYALKPICKELHNIYLNTRMPTTNESIQNYYYSLQPSKVFWRLFAEL